MRRVAQHKALDIWVFFEVGVDEVAEMSLALSVDDSELGDIF